jgi:hypothetical protein
MIMVHFPFSMYIWYPDTPSSLTTDRRSKVTQMPKAAFPDSPQISLTPINLYQQHTIWHFWKNKRHIHPICSPCLPSSPPLAAESHSDGAD